MKTSQFFVKYQERTDVSQTDIATDDKIKFNFSLEYVLLYKLLASAKHVFNCKKCAGDVIFAGLGNVSLWINEHMHLMHIYTSLATHIHVDYIIIVFAL